MPSHMAKLPKELQLATLVGEAPAGDAWLHEQKLDGYRILAEREGPQVHLWSRRYKDWTAQFPTVADAVAQLPATQLLLDGEVAAIAPDGRTSFQLLQGRGDGTAPLAYFVFDLLAQDGDDLAALPLEERKARLAALVGTRPGVIRYCDHVIGEGAAFFRAACEHGLEGIVSKRRDAPYQPGRGGSWLKTKCLARQELVIGGFTDPGTAARSGFGALLVGYHDGDRLAYAGKVGTGYSAKVLVELRDRLDRLEQSGSPFSPSPSRALTGPRPHWVEPSLVAEVAFTEWTADGRLRHPSFQGIRDDKRAADVVRERSA